MTSAEQDTETYEYPNVRPFLLMEGGPLYHVEQRVGLMKKGKRLTIRRAVVAALLAWFPLLILSAIQGAAWGHKVDVPYLRDFSAWTRFLIAIPLLLLAEIIIGPRVSEAAEHFVTSGVVTEKDYQRFDRAIVDGLRLRDSVLAEIILACIAYLIPFLAFRSTAVHASTWYATWNNNSYSITIAGWWMLLFCAPLLNFLLLRWLWRLFLWFRFLAEVRGMDIQLFPTHPDEAGGIGFVGEVQQFFGVLLFAYSAGIAGVFANDVVYGKVPLTHFAPLILAYAVCTTIVIVAPLTVFSGKLLRAKRVGMHEYGALATTYTGSFHRKWIRGENPEQEQLLGTGDIQSLADLGNSYAFIEKMNILPIDLRSLVQLVVAALLPMAPLLLAVMSPKELLRLIMKMLV
jgi:hypothetical protein